MSTYFIRDGCRYQGIMMYTTCAGINVEHLRRPSKFITAHKITPVENPGSSFRYARVPRKCFENNSSFRAGTRHAYLTMSCYTAYFPYIYMVIGILLHEGTACWNILYGRATNRRNRCDRNTTGSDFHPFNNVYFFFSSSETILNIPTRVRVCSVIARSVLLPHH